MIREGAISREEFQADDAAWVSAQAKLNAASANVREDGGEISATQAKLGGTRAAIPCADSSIAAASEKVAQMRVAVETAR